MSPVIHTIQEVLEETRALDEYLQSLHAILVIMNCQAAIYSNESTRTGNIVSLSGRVINLLLKVNLEVIDQMFL